MRGEIRKDSMQAWANKGRETFGGDVKDKGRNFSSPPNRPRTSHRPKTRGNFGQCLPSLLIGSGALGLCPRGPQNKGQFWCVKGSLTPLPSIQDAQCSAPRTARGTVRGPQNQGQFW